MMFTERQTMGAVLPKVGKAGRAHRGSSRSDVGRTTRQRLFVLEYVIDRNGRQAAIRAGYNERRAAVTACELLKEPEIARAIHRLDERRQSSQAETVALLLQTLEAIALADPRCLFDSVTGLLLPPDRWPAEAAWFVERLRIGKDGSMTIKLVCKLRAIESYLRHLGLLDGRPQCGDSSFERTIREIASRKGES